MIGFKCCKCRRIRQPDCPYTDPKVIEQKQLKRLACKRQKQRQGSCSGLDSDSERMSEQQDSKPSTPLPATPMFPPMDAFLPEDDPLLVSVSKVEQITPTNFDLEWNTGASAAPGPQKLPVRRQAKREDYNAEPQPTVKPEEAAEEGLPVVSDWDASGELLFDYEDMEFEPQTYFSLTELLTADDSNGQYDVNGDKGVPVTNPQGEATEEEEEDEGMGPCQRCSQSEPVPDLFCTVCGLLIHSHCSPWEEEPSSFPGTSWSCGLCREWQ